MWAAGADPGFYVIDFDGTLITAHSDKEGAAPTYKRGFGHHPLLAFLDATGEALAGILRPGNAGSNTTADHVESADDGAWPSCPSIPATVEVVARADSAALTHGFVDACRDAHVRFSIGHDLTEPIRNACLAIPTRRWRPAITADGSDERDYADVAEITDLVNLSRWPEGTRAIVRREDPHPGAQLTFTDIDGHRFQVFITDQTDDDIAYLEALQRGRGRAEKLICNLKDTGLTNLPSADMAINTAWLTTALIAHDLLAWCRLVCLDGNLADRRTETTPLHPLAHRRPDRPQRTTHPTPTRRRLAMGQRARHRLRPHPAAATADLNTVAAVTGAADRTEPDQPSSPPRTDPHVPAHATSIEHTRGRHHRPRASTPNTYCTIRVNAMRMWRRRGQSPPVLLVPASSESSLYSTR